MRLPRARASLLLAILGSLLAPAARAADAPPPPKWDPVPAVDWSKIRLADFADDELDLPYYLHRFHTVVEGVTESGPNRGFMSIPVWRGRDKNQQGPWNARVMESHLTLAFFYATPRPWNPYFASPAVRQRLEAMLTFWGDMQNADGRFSEYGPKQWNLPATAFATKFMGQTLTLLRAAGDKAPIDPALLKRVADCDRKAILATLTRDDLYKHGKSYTNQYLNVFAGAAAYLNLFPDEKEIAPLMRQKFADADRDFRSPAGYYYEADGPDFGYTLHTTESDLELTYRYFRPLDVLGAGSRAAGGDPALPLATSRAAYESEIADTIEKQSAAWNEWLGYNLLRQPDGSVFVLNRGCQTRQNQAVWPRQDGALCARVEEARAFATSREERQQWCAEQRKKLAADWGQFNDRPSGEAGYAVSPYIFLQRAYPPYYPPQEERDAAVGKLPYLARNNFTHQRVDDRIPAVFTFVRRPSYYAAFNSGPQITKQQRLGLGLLWSPKFGALVQSQTNTADQAWGTKVNGADNVYEAGDLLAEFTVDDRPVTPQPGNRDLPGTTLVARYKMGTTGHKTLVFADDHVEVRIEQPGGFTEQIPLIGEVDEKAFVNDHQLALHELTIEFPGGVEHHLAPPKTVNNSMPITVLTLSARESLTYSLRFSP